MLWPIYGIQSRNDPCYIYFLITMTYFVKVTQLKKYSIQLIIMIKNTVNAEMTHHINQLYVIMSYFLCCKKQTKYKKKIHIVDSFIEMHEIYARNKPWAVSSSENPVRANEGKPIALLLVPGLIPDVQ